MRKILRPVFMAPITEQGKLPAMDGIYALILRNAGTATVELMNGLYTLDSKETLALNVTEDDAVLNVDNITVNFDTGTGSVQNLQLIAMRATNC